MPDFLHPFSAFYLHNFLGVFLHFYFGVDTDDVGEPIPQRDDIALLESLRGVCEITMEDSVLQLARMVYTQLLSLP